VTIIEVVPGPVTLRIVETENSRRLEAVTDADTLRERCLVKEFMHGKRRKGPRAETIEMALYRLLTTRPNEVVTYYDVCRQFDHDVSRNSCWAAYANLRQRSPILSRMPRQGELGGWVLCVPMTSDGPCSCASPCRNRTDSGTCSVTKAVAHDGDWCGGWGA
jgi:hypothetical protein